MPKIFQTLNDWYFLDDKMKKMNHIISVDAVKLFLKETRLAVYKKNGKTLICLEDKDCVSFKEIELTPRKIVNLDE